MDCHLAQALLFCTCTPLQVATGVDTLVSEFGVLMNPSSGLAASEVSWFWKQIRKWKYSFLFFYIYEVRIRLKFVDSTDVVGCSDLTKEWNRGAPPRLVPQAQQGGLFCLV